MASASDPHQDTSRAIPSAYQELFDKHGLDISRRLLYELSIKPVTCVYIVSGTECRKTDETDKIQVGDAKFVEELVSWATSMYVDMTSLDKYQQDLKSCDSTKRIFIVALIDGAITLQDSRIKFNILSSIVQVGTMVEIPKDMLFGSRALYVKAT